MKKKKISKAVKKSPAKKTAKKVVSKFSIAAKGKQLVLHIGCDSDKKGDGLDKRFKGNDWREVRLSFNDKVKADITAKPTNLSMIKDNQFDAIWIKNKIDYFFDFEINDVFKECKRVLKNDGHILLSTPNIKDVAEKIYKNGIDQTLYKVNGIEVNPIDMLFGLQKSLKKGDLHQQHRNGFTPVYLAATLRDNGFRDVKVQREGYQLWAMAYKRAEDTEQNQRIKVINDDVNKMMVERDQIDKAPEQKVNY